MRKQLVLLAGLAMAVSAGSAAAGIISQQLGNTFVAFEAESYQAISNTAGRQWIEVNTTTPITTPLGKTVIPAGSNVSGVALLPSFGIANHESTITYRVRFTNPGTYRFYTRYSMYDSATAGNYGNEDSFYRPVDFNQAPLAGDANIVTGFPTSNVEGVYGWFNTGASYTVGADDGAAPYVEFKIDNREQGFTLDRIAFSTATNLTDAQLNALANDALQADTYFNNSSGDGNWSTAANWTAGAPAADKWAFLGGGLTASLNQAGQQAKALFIGHNQPTLPGAGTLNQSGGDLTVLDNLTVGPDGTTGAYTASGGTLTVGQTATGRANLYVARRTLDTAANTVGTLNLSSSTSFNAYLDRLVVAQQTAGASGGAGSVTGTLTLAQNNTIDANAIYVGYIDSGNISPTAGTINLGASNTIAVDNFYIGADKSTGTVTLPAGGTLNLGTSARRADLYVGVKLAGTSANSNGTLNLAGGTVVAWLDELSIGRSLATSAGVPTGSVTLSNSTGNQVDVNTMYLGAMAGDSGTFTMNGGTVTVNSGVQGGAGNGAINVNEGTMTVSGGLDIDALQVGLMDSDGGAATLTVNSGAVTIGTGTQDLLIGRRTVNLTNPPTPTLQGVVNLSASSGVTINANQILLGTIQGIPNGEGTAQGTLTLSQAGANVLTANSILLGDSSDRGNAVMNSIQLGAGANTINTNTLTIGGRKSQGRVTIAAGGTLTLGGKTPGTPVNLDLGINVTGTGVIGSGLLDVSSGTLNATIGTLRLGSLASGAGTATGMLSFGQGTVTANSVILGQGSRAFGTINMTGGTLNVSGSVSDGGGTSSINLDGGSMAVGGDFNVDSLRIAHNGRTASLTVAGSSASVGSGGTSDNLYIGRREVDTGLHAVGTLDLSGVATVNVNVNHVDIGVVPGAYGAGQGGVSGTLKLGQTNTIQAKEIWIADSPSVGIAGVTSRMALGQTNTVTADTLVVGGSKGTAVLDFLAPGSALSLGTSVRRADVLVGYQRVGTGGGSTGTMNLAGSTVTAFLDELVIGSKPNDASGTTSGTVTFDSGSIDVNSIVLARRTQAGTAGTVRGIFNLQGTGELTAGSIAKSVNANTAGDTVQFNFSGGTLHVGTFGDAAAPFNLLQNGGVLAPGNSIGTTTIYGNYTQAAAGTLEVEIAGPGTAGVDYDLVSVNGNADLDGRLLVDLVGYSGGLGDTFDVLTATGTIDIANLVLAGDPLTNTQWLLGVVAGSGGGQVLRLSTALPEPSTLAMAALGLGILAVWKRRRR
jgi:hypothetical protein